jgi:lysophospholipase L1-like esterase
MYHKSNIIYSVLLLLLLNSCGTSSKVSAESADNETNPIVNTTGNINIPIWIIGDSTVATYSDADSRKGWGQIIKLMFKNPSRVDNRARSGASSKSFKPTLTWDGNLFWGDGTTHTSQGNKSGLKEDISHTNTKNGGILFIQFGHNDTYNIYKTYNTEESTVPGMDNEFDRELMEYISHARKYNVLPILITPMARMFQSSLTDEYVHIVKELAENTPKEWSFMRGKVGDWPQTMRNIAQREKILLIDLTAKSKKHFNNDFSSSEEIRELYSQDGTDFTHFNETGAKKMADFIKDEIIEKLPNLAIQFK